MNTDRASLGIVERMVLIRWLYHLRHEQKRLMSNFWIGGVAKHTDRLPGGGTFS
jgi:hypothetical protein